MGLIFSLNPCSGGLWFLRIERFDGLVGHSDCLNPCSGGLWFMRMLEKGVRVAMVFVLILVLVDYGF